jgi:molybdopterin-containing oxidoreductase family iron-sulfur binding subunit
MSESCKTERARKPAEKQPMDLAGVREKLSQARGKQYWRSLEELAETEGFREMLHREFPRQASEWTDGVSRRSFLQLMGASLALAGLNACTKQPIEHIVPYVRQPEEIVPGKPLYFASAMPMGGYAYPVLVKSEMGRPIKVDGNPDHPAGNLGSDVFTQASILGLYDPDRSQTVTEASDARGWADFQSMLTAPLAAQNTVQGTGLRFLTGDFSSPTLGSQMQTLLRAFPNAKWHVWEPVNRDNARAGAMMVFGQAVEPQYKFESADVILSLDSDFMTSAENPSFLRDVKGYGLRRKVNGENKLNRLWVIESSPTSTGGKAEHRMPARASDIAAIARMISARIGAGTGGGDIDAKHAKFVDALVKDLQGHRGSSLVLAGEGQPPEVHALVHSMNQALGNVGKTVTYTDPVVMLPDGFRGHVESLRELVQDIEAGKVEMLVIIDCNPVYTAPAELDFARHLLPQNGKEQVKLRIHFGLYQDETARYCQWHVNAAHYLESWSDVRSADGTASIVQPLIDPLYGGKTAHDVLAAFSSDPSTGSYEQVRNYWTSQHAGGDFEAWWRRALHDGFIANSALPAKAVSARAGAAASPAAASAGEGLEIVFRPDSNLFDGRFANNGWLQELPHPITMFTWDNAAIFSFATAEKYKILSDDMVELDLDGRKLQTAAWVVPGVPDDSVTLRLGYGRDFGGRVAGGSGFNTYLLRTGDKQWFATGVKVRKTGEQRQVAAVHIHHNIEGRGTVRATILQDYEKNPDFAHEQFEEPSRAFTLYHPELHRDAGYAWGMTIDLNSCIGCNSCVAACQAENNIPVVGKWEVIRGREMHWIRIDNYFTGDVENPKAYFQPVPCMQCENAPCEVVCPVGATIHSSEGLNDMVYNRCVGTRYCSNNCPYKVRRFNFMLYADFETPQMKLLNNPDVTVRSRGVMEKCTYCVQRISRGRIEAEKAERKIEDGEVKTACQQSCPTDAIVFGDINDKNSRVSKLKEQQINYGMLAELNTRPRTTYLAAVDNPHPDLAEAMPQELRHALGRGHEPKQQQEP